jgi:hypothetical protein
VNAHSVQASLSQRLALGVRLRRRSVPPKPAVAVSQPVNQRWRERPRCPALRVTRECRDGVVHAIVGCVARRRVREVNVQDERAARAHVFVSSFAGRMWSTNGTEITSYPSAVFLVEATRLRSQIHAWNHRAFHAGAVLSLVNALRFASTRPSAGPAGIDDASARHLFGNYAMVGKLSTSRRGCSRRGCSRRGLTKGSRRRMLTSSRRCRMALPPFAATAYGARIRPAPTRHGIERKPQHRRLMHDDPEWLVGAFIELRTSGPLAAHYP